jgi:hypothetical protein
MPSAQAPEVIKAMIGIRAHMVSFRAWLTAHAGLGHVFW